jgi:hypothetical protein
MDICKVQPDGKEELLLSDVSPAEVDDLREWFSHTKPLGASVRLIVRQSSEVLYCMTSAGAEAEPMNTRRQPSCAA